MPSCGRGRIEAHLHVELVDADGLELADDHVRAIGQEPDAAWKPVPASRV